MIEIKIQVDVENHKEIAASQGAVFKLVPKFLLTSKVEEEIKKQLKKALNENLKNELSQRGVDAEVSVN
jgi:predicted lipid carrier protein YhbT